MLLWKSVRVRCRATAAQDLPWDRIPVSTRSVHQQLLGEAQIRLPCRSASSMEGFLYATRALVEVTVGNLLL